VKSSKEVNSLFDQTMKILMLNYEFPPLGGGAANANYYLLKEFSKNKKIEIDLITSSTSKYRKENFANNINIYYLDIGKNPKNLHLQSNKDLLTYSFKAYFFAKKILKNNQYDLIHAWFGIPCGFLAMLLRKPYIVALRGSDVPFYNKRFEIADKLLFKHLSKIIWKNATSVIANSEGLKQLALKSAPNQKIEVIYNGVDTNEFKPSRNKKYGKTLKIICVARLIKRKGIDYLLKALGELKEIDFQLTLIGDGDQEENLKNLAKELGISKKVKFLGAVPHSKIAKHYQENDLFVLPSLNEGMSNTILEAMACGLPIITTNTGGAKELIKKNGFKIKPGSVEELKKNIALYIGKTSLLKSQSNISRENTKKLSWKSIANNYLYIYKND
jgi:glycosyltransferase involved in cell wall biosynthesis